jgi:hypothetical protein
MNQRADDSDKDSVFDSFSPSEGYGFFIKIVDPKHMESIARAINKKKYFTEHVLHERIHIRQSDLVLVVSPDNTIKYVAHIRPTRAGKTGHRGFRADYPVELNIELNAISDLLTDDGKKILEKDNDVLSFRPSVEDWNQIWRKIKALNLKEHEQLRYLETLRFDKAFEFDDEGYQSQWFLEKDAVGFALICSGISHRGVFADLAEGLSNNSALLNSLCGNPIEDIVISHDTTNFPNYLASYNNGAHARFVQGTRTLDIYNVNRRSGEAAIGVDLIYHNTTYNSFVFVQYKMLDAKGKKQKVWRYYPDSQFHEELERMKIARTAFQQSNAPASSNSYRLAIDPFFFKFCRRQHLKMNAGELAHGHYLTLDHLELVLKELGSNRSPEKSVTLAALKRWIIRTHFAELVTHGWVGTRGVTDESLQEYIATAIASKKSVIVAISDEYEESDKEYEF